MLSKTIHLRPLRHSNVIRVRTPEKAAKIHERNSIIEQNFEYKPILKTSYDSSVYKHQRERIGQVPDVTQAKLHQSMGGESTMPGRDSSPCHAIDYFVIKKKQFNEQLKEIKNVPLSRVVSQEEFRALRGISQQSEHSPSPTRGEEADRRNIYRRNFYVSKPFTELNKDFKYQSQLLNAQTTSEDTPQWFQGTSKFYSPESLDHARKTRHTQSIMQKTDIFGKPNVKPPKDEYPFVAQPPSKGQRYELNKMVIVEKRTEKDFDSKGPHVQLKWAETPEKQSYDRARMTGKIGNAGEPVIKELNYKRGFDPLVAYKKVGELHDAPRIKQERSIDLKIGHPNDQYIVAKRKAREDGFYGNRKEITGESYQKSTFFV